MTLLCLHGNRAFVLSVVVILCMAALSSYGASDSVRQCRIQSMIGDVKVQKNKSKSWIEGRVGMRLSQADAIRTFVESEAVLIISEGHSITLQENTTLELATLSAQQSGTQTGIKILNGELFGNIKKLTSSSSKFEFETPTAVAAIRGTKIGISVDQSSTNVKVYEGVVLVTPRAATKGIELQTNQMTVVTKGQTQLVVQELKLPPPDQLKDSGTEVPLQLEDTTKADSATAPIPDSLGTNNPLLQQGMVPDTLLKLHSTATPSSTSSDTIASAQSAAVPPTTSIPAATTTAAPTATSVPVKPTQETVVMTLIQPAEGSEITKPAVTVSGTVRPASAEVLIGGISVTVTSQGSFSKQIPLPDEEGMIPIEVEARTASQSTKIVRRIVYRPVVDNITISLMSPQENQIVCDRRLEVKGKVSPVTVEAIEINGVSYAVRSGMFDGFVLLGGDAGATVIECEVSKGGKISSLRRTVTYLPASKTCNVDLPFLQPSALPLQTKQSPLIFTVFDKTPFDEITVVQSVDGATETEVVSPGSQVRMNVEEGEHRYELYAKDAAGNLSNKLSGTISYLMREISIVLTAPAADYTVIHIPPSTPSSGFEPNFTVRFYLNSLPDDNVKLLKEIRIINSLSSQSVIVREFSDVSFSEDIALQRGKNPITIEVRDCNDRIRTKLFTIDVR
ncbi:MAG: FecR domain-containing protein [Chitinivibrionales bacterium]|nr:FecR domain-containing protein [Chitinivibrionales bacterium]